MKISDIFTSVQSPDYPISQFDGNHFTQTTLSIGSLTPTKCVKYHPGDYFKMHSTTNVECPPLLSPSFQSYKLKEYLFKVRKGLTWKNDEYGKFVNSLYDGSVAPIMPFIRQDYDYAFGDAVLRITFNPKLPVFGLIKTQANGSEDIYFQTSNLPAGSFNDLFLNFVSLDDSTRQNLLDLLANSFDFEIVRENKRVYNDPKQVMYNGVDSQTLKPAYTRYVHKCTSPNTDGSPIDVRTPVATAPVDTLNSVTFSNLGNVHQSLCGVFLQRTPYYRPSELLESLGYPVQIIDVDNIDYVDMIKKEIRSWFDQLKSGNASATLKNLWYTDMQWLSGTVNGYSSSFPNPTSITNQPISSVKRFGHTLTIGSLLQMYAEFMIGTGHGDGSPMSEDNVFSIQEIHLHNLFTPPIREDGSFFNLDLGPLTSYWLIWNEYFRDASLSKPVGLLLDSGKWINSRANIELTQDKIDPNDQTVTLINGVTVDYDLPIDFGTNQSSIRYALAVDECYVDYTRIPQKCIDRNYFTSALPDISKVQVFAPVVPTLPSNGVVPSMSSAVDYKPTKTVDPSTTFMSIDAFRTANVLESFFVNSMLAGPRPVSLILMHFGEHSKDFRMEIPELIDASEARFSTRELTQQSETEQLPLGFQVAQMNIVKGLNEGSQSIDSDGDHGYLIRMVCLYPEVFEVGGLNKDLICDTPFDWMYFPAFGVLGEQAINQFELNDQPLDISLSPLDNNDTLDNFLLYQPQGYDVEFGYTARYGNLKRIPSEVHGRFLSDLRYWNLNRIQQPLSYNGTSTSVPTLKNSMQFLAVPKDTRMFVDKDQDNFKMFQYVDCQFTRKLPMISTVKLL